MNVTEHGWNGYDKEEPEILGGKPVAVFLCPPQIPRGLAWEFSPVLDGARLENKRAGFTSFCLLLGLAGSTPASRPRVPASCAAI